MAYRYPLISRTRDRSNSERPGCICSCAGTVHWRDLFRQACDSRPTTQWRPT